MSFSLTLIAFWLYAGRSVLLCAISAVSADRDKNWPITALMAIGLLIPPFLLAAFSWWSHAFEAVLALLICFDLALLYKLIRFSGHRQVSVSPTYLIFFVFTLSVLALSILNGPYLEHLPDSWWHMKNVSWMVNQETLILPLGKNESLGLISAFFSYLGLDYSSYRLQAFLVWMTDCSVLDSWIATSAVVSTLLGASIFLLYYNLRLDKLALLLSLLFWLVLFSGMNTGLRLGGWPAGMGYVFLNLGLVSSYQIFCDYKSREGWILLLLVVFGTAMFHLAELFLVLIAFATLLTTKLFFNKISLPRAIIVLGGYFALATIIYISASSDSFASIPAILKSSSAFFTAWVIGVLYFRVNLAIFLLVSCLLGSFVLFIVVDWAHLMSLFNPVKDSTSSYYSDYIPHYKSSWGGQFLIISKWAHQLRASILWSGVVAFFLAVWLVRNSDHHLAQWLLVLISAPWLILTSPAIFTFLSSFVPMYGVYRVQYLMPTAAILGLAASHAGRQLFSKHVVAHASSNKFRQYIPARFGEYLSTNSTALTLLFSGIYITYLVFVRTLNNFFEVATIQWFGPFLLVACIFACVRRISSKKILSFAILFVCALLLASDLAVRVGITGERPWAINSNAQFHWLLRDNRGTLRLHTSWRYQDDLENIRKLTNDDEAVGFFSDLATSYYVAAETKLRPLVQQAHHSRSGLRYNEIMQAFCNLEISGEEFLNRIYAINARSKSSKSPGTRYIVINRDTINYSAELFGASCVGETDHFLPELSGIAEIKFKGNFLSLWELKNSQTL